MTGAQGLPTEPSPSQPITRPRDRDLRRSAGLALAAAYVGVLLLCLPFFLADVDVPVWVLLVGRWIPALASLGGLALVGAGRAWPQVWALAPGGWRGWLRAYGVAVAVMALVTCLPALVVGLASPQAALSGETWLFAAPLLALGGLVLAASTLGEEVFWRAHLPAAMERLGFWRSTAVVGVLWALWHVPLHALYLLQGTLPTTVVVASTLSLVAWAPLLAALVHRLRSVWPAVFAHAVPVSATQLVVVDEGAAGVVVGVVALNAAAMVGVAAWLVRSRPR